jgi:hypothetical protein
MLAGVRGAEVVAPGVAVQRRAARAVAPAVDVALPSLAQVASSLDTVDRPRLAELANSAGLVPG